jgi:hypothetical protein
MGIGEPDRKNAGNSRHSPLRDCRSITQAEPLTPPHGNMKAALAGRATDTFTSNLTDAATNFSRKLPQFRHSPQSGWPPAGGNPVEIAVERNRSRGPLRQNPPVRTSVFARTGKFGESALTRFEGKRIFPPFNRDPCGFQQHIADVFQPTAFPLAPPYGRSEASSGRRALNAMLLTGSRRSEWSGLTRTSAPHSPPQAARSAAPHVRRKLLVASQSLPEVAGVLSPPGTRCFRDFFARGSLRCEASASWPTGRFKKAVGQAFLPANSGRQACLPRVFKPGRATAGLGFLKQPRNIQRMSPPAGWVSSSRSMSTLPMTTTPSSVTTKPRRRSASRS